MKRVYFFTGLPCSGKTYAAKLIANKVFNGNCTHISCGDIARELMVNDDLKKQTAANDLFPLEDALRLELKNRIDKAPNDNVVVDGFPRFDNQAHYIVDEFWHYHPVVIEVNVGDSVTLINRAKMRARDENDETSKFINRLSKAESNMSGVFKALASRLCPYRTLLSGDDASIIYGFKLIQKVNDE